MGTSWKRWIGVLAVCVAAVLLGVTTGRPEILAIVMSIIAVAIASIAIAENRAMIAKGASDTAIATLNSRHMALVWSLGALSLFGTYTFLLEWKEWLTFTGFFAAVALLCIGFAITIAPGNGAGSDGAGSDGEGSDGKAKDGDAALLNLARYLTIGQLAGMIATMIGLVIDGKMPASALANPGWYDWAGNVIFFYGALALVAISANALMTGRKSS